MKRIWLHSVSLILAVLPLLALATDRTELTVEVYDLMTSEPLPMAVVLVNQTDGHVTDHFGKVRIPVEKDEVALKISYVGFEPIDTVIDVRIHQRVSFGMNIKLYKGAVIYGEGSQFTGVPGVSVDNFTVYAGKKADIIRPSEITLSGATATARQLFSHVSGLNIFDNSDAGLQLNIGGRGLNPNRTSNFNTRQNGYDISADPLGYPESYYAPPIQAIQKIELIRGAASLQFGPQFGGMLNYDLIDASKKKLGVISEQSMASFGILSSFNAIGGTVDRTEYMAYYQRKQGEGWRPNSDFKSNNAHVSVGRKLDGNGSINIEWSYYDYLAKQAGGLTDAQFEQDPTASYRDRNWFKVKWNLLALNYEQDLNSKTRVLIRPFMLSASREALGVLGRISRLDLGGERDLIRGEFNNWGVEGKIRRSWELGKQLSTSVFGVRYFDGNTRNQQGLANDGDDASFEFISSDAFNGSDYDFDNENVAVFLEQIIRVKGDWTITPGFRFEHISTASNGNYTQVVRDGAGNILPSYPRVNYEADNRTRNILLYGLGVSKRLKGKGELYANFSRNYRGINFSDIRIINPNQVVDPSITDEQGFTADLGYRGVLAKWIFIDASLFFLAYEDKIGNNLESVFVSPALGTQVAQVRKNISNAYTAGIEFTSEIDVLTALQRETENELRAFVNVAHIQSEYLSSDDSSIDGNTVEYVPEWNIKTGASFKVKAWSFGYQFTLITEQFTDASNAPFGADPNAVVGAIPTYSIHDVNIGYRREAWSIQAGIDNVLNSSYFTRRASGYPGPGIIPAAPRSLWVGLKLDLW